MFFFSKLVDVAGKNGFRPPLTADELRAPLHKTLSLSQQDDAIKLCAKIYVEYFLSGELVSLVKMQTISNINL